MRARVKLVSVQFFPAIFTQWPSWKLNGSLRRL